MSKPVVSVRGIGKRYTLGIKQDYDTLRDRIAQRVTKLFRGNRPEDEPKSFWALRDVSFDIAQGEVVGVIGRNGAGKSTLLKVLSQITEPTEGEVHIRGRVASLLEVGTGFHPELTGRENVFLNGAILGMGRSEIRKKFDEIVAFSEISDFIDTPVKRYSSGMYVRLAFAVAAHLDPEILVVDEVLAVGDLAFRKKCMGKMGDVAKGGRTVFFVSHSMSAVQLLCTRGLLLENGSMKLDGPAKTVVGQYLSNFAAITGDVMDLTGLVRKGSGRALMRSLQIHALAADGTRLEAVVSGCNVEIVLTVEAVKNIQSANPSVTIYDSSGYRLLDVDCAMKGCLISMAAGETRQFRFLIKDCLLNAGTYFVGLWVGVAGVEHIDWIEFATSLEVLPDAESGDVPQAPGTYRCRYDMQVI